MRQSPHERRIAFSAISLSIVALLLGGCASDEMHRPLWSTHTDPEETREAAAQLPPNYRQLMAQYICLHTRYVIRDAKITPPYKRYGGILHGGTIPAVCIAIYRDNPFGVLVRDNHVLSVENGQVQEIAMGIESCTELSAFTELTQR
jgi:hypothetical protein